MGGWLSIQRGGRVCVGKDEGVKGKMREQSMGSKSLAQRKGALGRTRIEVAEPAAGSPPIPRLCRKRSDMHVGRASQLLIAIFRSWVLSSLWQYAM